MSQQSPRRGDRRHFWQWLTALASGWGVRVSGNALLFPRLELQGRYRDEEGVTCAGPGDAEGPRLVHGQRDYRLLVTNFAAIERLRQFCQVNR